MEQDQAQTETRKRDNPRKVEPELSELRRRARRRLRISEIRYRRLFESARDGILILNAASGKITDVNPFMIELLGYTREEFLGKELWQIGLLQDAESSRKALQELQESGFIRYEHLPLETRSGELREVEFVSNVYDENGRQVIQCNIRDSTARKKAERDSRENTERFRFLAESMPQKIFTSKPNGEIDYFNQQWTVFTGLTFEEIRDWGWVQFIHPDDLQENLRCWQHSLDTGEPFQLEHRFRRADGVYRWHLSRAHVMRDTEGKAVMWISSNTDIDDQKRAEGKLQQLMSLESESRAEAERANRAKDEFLALASHELRTPLTAILGWCSLQKNRKLDKAETDHAMEVISRNAKSLAQLVEDILDISRITSGKLRLEVRQLSLARLILNAVESVCLGAGAKEIHIATHLDSDAGMVSGDPERLQQVLLNLLSNAIKFTPRGGRISVTLERAGSDARIKVTDSGQGINADFLPYVFDHFRQFDSATTRQYSGLGLGLSIVRNIVELHGGTVRVESPGVGQGSSFTVHLPAVAVQKITTTSDSKQTKTSGEPRIIPRNAIQNLRVLIVDDEPSTLEMLTAVLEHAGALVKTSSSATTALALWLEWKPDVLLSDVAMPEKDGFWLIQQIRTLEPGQRKRIPAVALTAYIRIEDRARLLAEGFDMFVPKPVEPAELIAVVAGLAAPATSI